MTRETIIILLLLACNIFLAYKIYRIENKPKTGKDSDLFGHLLNNIAVAELTRVVDNQAALLKFICTHLVGQGFVMPTDEQIKETTNKYRQT